MLKDGSKFLSTYCWFLLLFKGELCYLELQRTFPVQGWTVPKHSHTHILAECGLGCWSSEQPSNLITTKKYNFVWVVYDLSLLMELIITHNEHFRSSWYTLVQRWTLFLPWWVWGPINKQDIRNKPFQKKNLYTRFFCQDSVWAI